MLSRAARLLAITALVALTTFTTSAEASKRRNIAPTISGTPLNSVAAAATYSFQPTAYDANGDALTFSIANKPVWATFSSSHRPADRDAVQFPGRHLRLHLDQGERR